MSDRPELFLIVCEGKTEVLYFNILQRRFRLPAWVKVIPEIKESNNTLGQHEVLIDISVEKKEHFAHELTCPLESIEAWAVFDRDDYKERYTVLEKYAQERGVQVAFSDPQFENYLLQHFSDNKSRSSGSKVERELTECMNRYDPSLGLYRKNDLTWLDSMIDKKHTLVQTAAINASHHDKHTEQPFFTIYKLIFKLLEYVE